MTLATVLAMLAKGAIIGGGILIGLSITTDVLGKIGLAGTAIVCILKMIT